MILFNDMPILKKIFFYAFLLGCLQFISGQKYVRLSVDNDLYFLTDRYYSSGIFLSYGYKKIKQVDELDSLDNSTYVHWHLGQEVYTPARLQTKDLSKLDYPFGGWLFIEREVHKYLNKNTAYAWGIQIGTTGDESLAPWMQNFYHLNFLKLPRVTWEDAMPQEMHLNLNVNMKKKFMLEEKFYFLSDFFSSLGTQKKTIGAQFGFFMGKQIDFLLWGIH